MRGTYKVGNIRFNGVYNNDTGSTGATFTYYPARGNTTTPRYETLEFGHYETERRSDSDVIVAKTGPPPGVKLGCPPGHACGVSNGSLRVYVVERDPSFEMKYVISNSSFDPPTNIKPRDFYGPRQDGNVAKLRFDLEDLQFSYPDWHFRKSIGCRMSYVTIKSARNLQYHDGHAQAKTIECAVPVVSTENGNISTWDKGRYPGTVDDSNSSYKRFIGPFGGVIVDLYNEGDVETEWNRIEVIDQSTKDRTGSITNYVVRGVAACNNGARRYTDWTTLAGLTIN